MPLRICSLLVVCCLCTLIPHVAWGCSVCFLAKQENLMAYFGTGILLSVLPFLLIGSGGWWLYRQMKARPVSFAPEKSLMPERKILDQKGSL